MTTRDAAISAARRGWSVFPIAARNKKPPLVDDWERRACADPDRVGRYWPGHANVGIACGPSGLVVVDLDTHGDLPDEWQLPGIRDGRDVLAQLCEWAGQPWPATHWITTASGGWHFYFAAPEGSQIRNSAGQLGPMIDVRACGGYVVGAGSVVGGRTYETFDDSDPMPLPPWLAALASPLPPRPVAYPAAGRVSAPADSRLRGLAATVAAGKRGDRNGPLYWAACRAAEMIAAGEADRQAAEETLIAAALEAGLRGGEREARRTFASAMRGGSR